MLPCDIVLPASTIVVDTDSLHTTDNETYFVCSQTTLSYTGSGATIVMEGNNSELLLNGTPNTVYLQSNSDMATFTDGNTMFLYESGATIDDQSGGFNPTQLCTTIIVDTSLLPISC